AKPHAATIAVSLSTCFDAERTADRDVRALRVHGRGELDPVYVEAGPLEPLLRQGHELRLVRERGALRRQQGLAARVGQRLENRLSRFRLQLPGRDVEDAGLVGRVLLGSRAEAPQLVAPGARVAEVAERDGRPVDGGGVRPPRRSQLTAPLSLGDG